MVCSICKQAGHNASNCNGPFIREWTENIKRFWIYGYNNSIENDEAVKEWARTFRLTRPIINRLWVKLREINYQKQWWRLSDEVKEQFVQTKFALPRFRGMNISDFRAHIANYVRPAEQEPIAEALAELNRIIEERRQRLRQEREEPARLLQERRDRVVAESIARRQREAVEDPNAQVRRNLQQDFERAHQMFRRVEAQAIQALKPKRQVIQCKMDPLETEYFENTDCPICLEALPPENTVALDCRHICCVDCLKQTLKISNKRTCPTCRADIKTVRFKSTISPDNFNTISAQINSLV